MARSGARATNRLGGALPIVAIVGRPNVGKSTLFNRVIGARTAIVEDRARTTRDRLYGDAEWNGRRFMLVDTGGLEVDTDDPIELRVQEQARLAIAESDVIVFVVDAAAGMTPADLEAAELLRRAPSPVIVAVNKADNEKRELEAAEFHALGWDETYPVSASHGRGTGDLLDAIVWALPPESEQELARKAREVEAETWADEVAAGRLDRSSSASPRRTRTARVTRARTPRLWRPRAGTPRSPRRPTPRPPPSRSSAARTSASRACSTRCSARSGRSYREVPGTTRDAIDTRLAWGRSEVVLIDTAGIRRRGKVASGPAAERYSTMRALTALSRADVAVLVIDAVEGLTSQDAHVAGYAVEEGKGLVLAVNKWDLVADKTDRTFDQYIEWIRNEVPFIEFAPIVSISAKTGQRVGRVLELAVDIWAERRRRIPTGELNRVLTAATERTPPPPVRGHRPRLFYATQATIAPPTFVFFASDASAVHFSYRRYLENRLRETFGFDGTPIRLVFRDRASVKLPRKRRSKAAAAKPARRTASARTRKTR